METLRAETDLNDVTFLIRLRIDSIDRLENLLMVVDFIISHFQTNIRILETARFNKHILEKILPSEVSLSFIEDYDPIYHYTKFMNIMTKACHTPFVAVWEADVIVPPDQIIQSIKWLRQQEADFVSPYKDSVLDTSDIIRELYFKTRDINILQEHAGKMKELYNPNPVGGAFLADREAYINSGMENENFYGWGREDGDRVNRWNIMGYRHKRTYGSLFHLTHKRGINSRFHSAAQDNIKSSEVFRVFAMSKKELTNEIKSWW